ncbi:MAG: hypothetical protein V1744_03965, partial [Candidatus Altiarchaeota archaeon]
MKYWVSFVIVCLVGCSTVLAEETGKIYADKTSTVYYRNTQYNTDPARQGWNSGGCSDMLVSNYDRWSVLSFDISPLKDKETQTATLKMYKIEKTSGSGRIYELFYIQDNNWVQGTKCRAPAEGNEITYDNRPSSATTPDASFI